MTRTQKAIEALIAARATVSVENHQDPDEMLAEAITHIDEALDRLEEHKRLVTKRDRLAGARG